MEDRKGRVRKWKSREEELESLRNNPVAQSLLEDLRKQDPERVAQLMDELRDHADEEDEQ